jgi:hypothetical protein
VSSEYVNFWDYDRDAVVSCPSCGWTGRPGDNEGIHRDLLDVFVPSANAYCLSCLSQRARRHARPPQQETSSPRPSSPTSMQLSRECGGRTGLSCDPAS